MKYGVAKYDLSINHEYPPEPPYSHTREEAQRHADQASLRMGRGYEFWVVEVPTDTIDPRHG